MIYSNIPSYANVSNSTIRNTHNTIVTCDVARKHPIYE